jgi:glycosyltransferase involved in cell wall biosynthesis
LAIRNLKESATAERNHPAMHEGNGRRLRIAHFVQRYPPALGGSEAYFARLSRFLAAAGHDVFVFTTTAIDLEAFWTPRGRRLAPGVVLQDGVTVRRYKLWHAPEQRQVLRVLSQIPVRSWQRLTLSCNPIAWGMWRDAGRAEESFDLVHASAFPYGWPLACGLRLARRLGVPFLLTPFLHTGDPEDPRDRTRRAYTSPGLMSLGNAAARVFVQTEGERDALLQRGVPEHKLVLQGMGVDLAACTGGARDRVRAEWEVHPDEVVIGHLANLSVEKGSVDLLRAARHAWRHGSHFRLVLAGPEMPNFRRFRDQFPAAGRVRRLGVLTDQQKRDFFAGIDVFALPSRSDSFGLVLLEAWANRAANVGYRAGGVAGVIRHEKDGLLVRCGDICGLADAITRLATNAEYLRQLGIAGCDRLQLEFNWQDKLQRVQRTYEELTERKSPPAGNEWA